MANNFLLIIDGSSLLSTQYYGNLPREILYARTEEEKAQYYHKLMQTSNGIYTNGVFGFFKTLLSILQNQKPKYLAICWDVTRDTFRRALYDDYKGNRKTTPEPLTSQFALCQEVLERIGIKQFASKDYEADDYAGSLSEKFKKELPISIMTKDRDYLQLVDDGVSMWLVTSSSAKAQELYKKHNLKQADYIVPDSMFYLTPELVMKEFGYPPEKTVMVKQLAGDSSDNIPGVKGIGEKTAIALANAYPSIEAMYDEIRDLDEAGLDLVKQRWKEELGIKRSPFKYLLAESETELVGEKASRLSHELAVIKRDIPMDEITLESLVTSIHVDEMERILHELEFQSLSVERIDTEFLDGERTSAREEIKVHKLAPEVFSEYVNEAIQAKRISLSVYFEKIKPNKVEEKQMSLFDFMGADASNKKSGDEPEKEGKSAESPGSEGVYRIFVLAFSYQEGECFVLQESQGYSQEQLRGVVNQLYKAEGVTIAFDVKEQLPLLEEGLRASFILQEDCEGMPAFDLSVAAYLMNPLKSKYTPYEVCLDYAYGICNRDDVLGKQHISELSQEQLEQLVLCCGQEAEAGLACEDRLRKELINTEMWQLFCQIEMPTLYTLYEMEYNGVIVKREALRQYGNQLMGSINRLEQSIYEQAGHEFNINSPKQLGVVLFEELGLPSSKKTKTGYSTSADVLEGLKQQSAIVADILEYRQLTKLHSTYAEGLAAYIGEDGRIHGHFNQTVTATGRISSTEPNLQNIPMRTSLGREIRKVFLPETGYVFVDADYSQIELRILAHMSGDGQLKEAYRTGQDIHALTASQVFHVPFQEVTPLQRRNAKAVNFGIVYGISAHGLSVDLGISRKEAADYMERYFETYPKIKQFLDGMVEEGRKNGQVRTLFGRIRPIPELHSTNYNQRSFGERVAMNSPIQGTAADIMKIAMLRTYRGLVKNRLKSRLVLQIHDELVVETREDELEQVQAIIKDAMTNAAQLSVCLSIDMNVGDSWYNAK